MTDEPDPGSPPVMPPRLRRLLPTSLLAALLLVVGGCAVFEPEPIEVERQALARARAQWGERGPRDYRYVYAPRCECPPTLQRPVWVTVREGAVRATAYVDGLGPELTTPYGYPTIDELFAELELAYRQQVPSVQVRYDGTLGYPADATIASGLVTSNGVRYGFAASTLSSLPVR